MGGWVSAGWLAGWLSEWVLWTLCYWTSSPPSSGAGSDCAATAQFKTSCTGPGYTFTDLGGGECQCVRHLDVFAKNPEHNKFVFMHGYEVAMNAAGSTVVQGSSNSEHAHEGSTIGRKSKKKTDMKTVFYTWD